MAVLSRWAGSLLDRFGARLPLIIGPAIAGVGFVLLALPGAAHSYLALLAPMIVLGLGMAITVAPLTTSVINAVPERQAGIASGINNAVASLASLLGDRDPRRGRARRRTTTRSSGKWRHSRYRRKRATAVAGRAEIRRRTDNAAGRGAQGRRDDRAAIAGQRASAW